MTASTSAHSIFDILLVEDNRADIVLTTRAFETHHPAHRLHVVTTGDEAMAFVRQEGTHQQASRPHLILLDLNLPGMDGREVLVEIKADRTLRRIPVVVLTSSESKDDLLACYDSHTNAYMTKPRTFDELVDLTRRLTDFWFSAVHLPPTD